MLNLSRWLAALVVVLGHTAHFVLVRVGTLPDRPVWLTAVYVLRNCHLQAVWVFCLERISGGEAFWPVTGRAGFGSFRTWCIGCHAFTRC